MDTIAGRQETSARAVVCLVLGVLSIFTMGLLVFGLAGVVMGSFAISDVRINGRSGYGMAVAGITLCIVSLVIGLSTLMLGLDAFVFVGFGILMHFVI